MTFLVAPLAGAWIETLNIVGLSFSYGVAPLAGAWIETCEKNNERRNTQKSRPSRARGLKLRQRAFPIVSKKSRPSRARGLKHIMTEENSQGIIGRAPRGRVD